MSKHRYHINVFWSHRDSCWVADVPDFRFCSAFGDTPLDAVVEVSVAIDLWLVSVRECGLPIPERRYRPAIYAVRR